MFPIRNYGDFKVYLPRPQDIAKGEVMMESCRESNLEFFRKAEPRSASSAGRITGTFICAHAPDYRGRPMVNADVREWKELFLRFRSFGMDTAIFQAALWEELAECYYTTKIFRDFRSFRVLEPMLEAAQTTGFRIYLGGYGSITGWNTDGDSGKLTEEIERQKYCFRELRELGRPVGYYFPCESAFTGFRNPEHESKMNRLTREFCSMVKDFDSSLETISSPGTKYFPGKEEEFRVCWENVLKEVPLDILMPQDSIGTCGCTLAAQRGMWRCWKKVTDSSGIRLWGNIELFERTGFQQENNFEAASPERVSRQMENLAPFAEKLCCWEAGYFASSDAGPESGRLAEFLRRNEVPGRIIRDE